MTPYRALLNEESEEGLQLDAGLVHPTPKRRLRDSEVVGLHLEIVPLQVVVHTSANFVSIHERWV